MTPGGRRHAQRPGDTHLEEIRPPLASGLFNQGPDDLKGRPAVPEDRPRGICLGTPGDPGSGLGQGHPGVLEEVGHANQAALAGGVGEQLAQGDLAGRALEFRKAPTDRLIQGQASLIDHGHDEGCSHPLGGRGDGKALVRGDAPAVHPVEQVAVPVDQDGDAGCAPGEDGVEARLQACGRRRRRGGLAEDAEAQGKGEDQQGSAEGHLAESVLRRQGEALGVAGQAGRLFGGNRKEIRHECGERDPGRLLE